MRDEGSDSGTTPPAAPARRLAWFVAIWAGGVVALGVVAWGGLWLAGLVHAQGEQLERQRERIALLESSLQMLEVEIEQKTAAPAVAPGVENAPRDSSFPRIAPLPAEPPKLHVRLLRRPRAGLSSPRPSARAARQGHRPGTPP